MQCWLKKAGHGGAQGAEMNPTVKVLDNADAVATYAASCFADLAQRRVEEAGKFTVALSGGSTPQRLYRRLAGEQFSNVPWDRIHLFWGDERYVSRESEQSNYRMVNESLLSALSGKTPHVHPVHTEKSPPPQVAEEYEKEIRKVIGDSGTFDLLLLGMGEDGHTASLFPETEAVREQKRLFVENFVPEIGSWRFTITSPVISGAAKVFVLVTGTNKTSTVREVFEESNASFYPVSIVNTRKHPTVWMLDRAAAAELGSA